MPGVSGCGITAGKQVMKIGRQFTYSENDFPMATAFVEGNQLSEHGRRRTGNAFKAQKQFASICSRFTR